MAKFNWDDLLILLNARAAASLAASKRRCETSIDRSKSSNACAVPVTSDEGNGIYKQAMRKTGDDFGEGINPHLFCSILATSVGRSDVANRFSAHSVLANTPRVSGKA